jgi:hypothetical protein
MRTGQTCLTLFFFLRLGGQTRFSRISPHCRNATARVCRRAIAQAVTKNACATRRRA